MRTRFFPPFRRFRRLGHGLVLVAATLLASGCQLDLEVSVEVNRDGGGVLAVTVGADPELVEQAAAADADPLGDLAAAGRGLQGDRWRVADRTRAGGGRTVTLSREFADAAEFNATAEQLAQALAADEVVLLEALRLAVTDDRISLSGGAAAQPTRAVRDYGLTRRQAVELIAAEEALAYRVTVNLPGEVLSSTAPEQDGSSLTWTIAPGESVDIAAESTRPGPPILQALVGALGGALVAGAALFAWSRRRARRQLA